MIRRIITDEVIESSREYPVVAVFGPRQSGKTTLSQMVFPGKPYYSIEEPDLRIAIEADPRTFFAGLPDGAILDEIQRLPHLLSYIQGIVDREKKKGMFILTGSHQPALHEAVSQSLAGRTAILNLLPYTFGELKNYQETWQPFDLIVQGAFPRLHQEKLNVQRFFNGYVQTYLERDIRSLINIKDLGRFQQFLVLLAGRVGQIINYTSLSNDVGVSATTIKNWVSALKASFILFELPPYFSNIRKRVVKSPKLYFCDTGLVCHLLGIRTAEQAFRDPLRGALYENLIILEIYKAFLNRGIRPDLYFYRDSHGLEIDLIIQQDRKLIPIEVKSAATFTKRFLKNIDHFRKLLPAQSLHGIILYNGEANYRINDVQIYNPLSQNGFPQVFLPAK